MWWKVIMLQIGGTNFWDSLLPSMYFFKHIILWALILHSISRIFRRLCSMSLSNAERSALPLLFQMKQHNYLFTAWIRTLKTWRRAACDINFRMAKDLTIWIFPKSVSPRHFHILRADVNKYWPEIYVSEKSKILKKFTK